MNVLNRFTDVINSNISSILDDAEDPEKMIRLVINEMRETLFAVQSETAREIAEKKRAGRRIECLREEVSEWEHKASMALAHGREDLARLALAEKQQVSDALEQQEAARTHHDHAIAKLQDDTHHLREKLRHAMSRRKALVIRGTTARSRIKVKRQLHDASTSEALSRFDLYERRLDEMEGEVETYELGDRYAGADSDHPSTGTRAHNLASEIERLASDERIDNELIALKERRALSAPNA